MRHLFFILAVLGLATFTTVSGCGKPTPSAARPAGPLNLVATTGQINSALTAITAGSDATIKLFCGPGVDPHSFSASTNDIQAMKDADAIIYNGFHLEARLHEHLHDLFSDKAWAMASAFPDDARLEWLNDGRQDPDAPFDPHIWNHLPGWMASVAGLTEELVQLSPKHEELFRANSERYIQSIQTTHQWALELLQTIPQPRRFIVSAHDAFNYFAKVYDMKTLAVLGIGNDAEADIQTMQKVADTIVEKKIPVIFLEAITNPKVSVALKEACEGQDWKVKIVKQQLFSDDLGETPPLNEFLGAFRSNVEIIVDNLK